MPPRPRLTMSALALIASLAAVSAALAAKPAAAAAPDAAYRLGHDVVPVSQAVKLWVDADQKNYRGTVAIALQVKKQTASFRFHAQGLEIAKATLAGPKAPVAITIGAEDHGIVTASCASPLEPGRYTLTIDFSNDFNTQAASLYKLSTGGHAYTFTQFESDDARGAFPCWDEPGFKIPWQVTLVVPKGHLAIANTPIEKESVEGDQKTVTFKTSPPMPSYLVAIATGPFETIEIPGMSIPGRVITVQGQSGLTGETVRMTPPLLKALEAYFGRPYPYEKLDLLAVPEYWYGAMENAGAITFRDNILLIDPKTANDEQRRRLAEITAHELAHMWFGDLVTMQWWDDMWLNESFASWMGDKITQQVYPQFGSGIQTVNGRERALVTDARPSTRAIRQPVLATDNLLQIADELAYQKGQSVLEMFERYLGADKFQKGVIAYLDEHEWGNAVAADLWNALSKAGKAKVSVSMPTFLDQPGFPLVSVEPASKGRVTLRQRRFANAGVPIAGDEVWRIPVVIKYGEGGVVRTQSVMLNDADMTIKLESPYEWIHPNADETGYYRWDLPPALLQTLCERASTVLSTRERMGLALNLSALLDAGELHGDQYLRALAPLADDRDPEVVAVVLTGLEKVRRTFIDEDQRASYATYIRHTLTPAWNRIGPSARPGETSAAAALRPRLMSMLADEGGDDALLTEAERLAKLYTTDPGAVDPSVLSAVVPLSARRGDQALFDDYRKRFETATVPTERSRYLNALGYFRDPTIKREALDYVLTGPLRPQELFTIPMQMTFAGNESDHDLVYRFWTGHYDQLATRVPPMFMGFLPRQAGGCSAERLAEAEKFFADPRHQAPGWEREMKKASDQVTDCVSLRNRERAAVLSYLQSIASN